MSEIVMLRIKTKKESEKLRNNKSTCRKRTQRGGGHKCNMLLIFRMLSVAPVVDV